MDNVVVERLWHSVTWEEVYPHDEHTMADAARGLDRSYHFYNHQRPHQALGYSTPAQVDEVA